MALRLMEASSSLWPPERKVIPADQGEGLWSETQGAGKRP